MFNNKMAAIKYLLALFTSADPPTGQLSGADGTIDLSVIVVVIVRQLLL